MNALVITPNNRIMRAELTPPLYRSAGQLVGGDMEIVRPMRLPRPYCMICNDDFLALGLLVNPTGCYLYGTALHGNPICGTILLMKEITRGGVTELAGLDDGELERMEARLRRLAEEGDTP